MKYNIRLLLTLVVCSLVSPIVYGTPLTAETLSALGDFNTTSQMIVPQFTCNLNSRSIIAMGENRNRGNSVIFKTSGAFPADRVEIGRILSHAYFESFPCLEQQNNTVIARTDGAIIVDASDKVTVVQYPQSLHPAEVTTFNNQVHFIGENGSIWRLSTSLVFEEVLAGISSEAAAASRKFRSSPSSLVMGIEDLTLEFDLTTLTRSQLSGDLHLAEKFWRVQDRVVMIFPEDDKLYVGSKLGTAREELAGVQSPRDFQHHGGHLYFISDDSEVWSTEGTIPSSGRKYSFSAPFGAATQILCDVNSGILLQDGELLVSLGDTGAVDTLADGLRNLHRDSVLNDSGRRIIVGQAKPTGDVMIDTDGTIGGTLLSFGTHIGVAQPSKLQNDIIAAPSFGMTFARRVTTGLEELLVRDLGATQDSNPVGLGIVDSRLVFGASVSSRRNEIFTTDGSTAGTKRIGVATRANEREEFVSLGELLGKSIFALEGTVFVVEKPATSVVPIELDTTALTGERAPIRVISTGYSIGDALLFMVKTGGTSRLWRTDGTAAGTVLVHSFAEMDIRWRDFYVEKGIFYCAYLDSDDLPQVWKSDGTAPGTQHITGNYRHSSYYYTAGEREEKILWYDAQGVPTVVWNNPDVDFDGCGRVSLLSAGGSTFFRAPCRGLFRLLPEGTGFSKVIELGQDDAAQVIGDKIFIVRNPSTGSEAIERINPASGTSERIAQLPKDIEFTSLELGAALGDKIILSLRSSVTGNEPYVLDKDDLCPNDPQKSTPGVCGCGVVDEDRNGNGTIDCLEPPDQCPNDTSKSEPGVCGCGVSDSDNNSNGIVDCKEPADECPLDPSKTTVGVCGCGVADTDANLNGTVDCQDLVVSSLTLQKPKLAYSKKTKVLTASVLPINARVQYRFNVAIQKPGAKKPAAPKVVLSSTPTTSIRGLKSGSVVFVSYYVELLGTPILSSTASGVQKRKIP